jgi:hypothetical protein
MKRLISALLFLSLGSSLAATLEIVALSNTAAPGDQTGFKSFGDAVINAQSDIAFDAVLQSGPAGPTVSGFKVRNVYVDTNPNSVSGAETLLLDPIRHLRVASATPAVINYHGLGNNGHYGADSPFPGDASGGSATNFIVEATADILIPAAGAYTFGVNSDDGFSVSIGSQYFEFPNGRAAADTLATFNLQPGFQKLRLVYYQGTQGYTLELFAAAGTHTTWNSNFKLIGDTANGGLKVNVPQTSFSSLANQAIYRKRVGGTVEKVVQRNDLAPTSDGGGIRFDTLFSPVIDAAGNVAFRALLKIDDNKVHGYSDQGIWTSGNSPGQLFFLTRENYRAVINYNGTLIPWENGPPLYDSFSNPTISRDGTVSFKADLKSFPAATYNNTRGIWYRPRPAAVQAQPPPPLLAAWSNINAPGTTNVFDSFRAPLFGNNTQSVFHGVTNSSDPLASEGIWSGVPSVLSLLIGAGTAAPGMTGAPLVFDLGTPTTNSQGQFAFWAGVNHAMNSEGIWMRSGGTTAPLVVAGSAAPGVSGLVFSHFLDPVINERGQAAVLGYLKTSAGQPAAYGQDHGIWSGGSSGYLRLVVKAGDAAPGTNGLVFRQISSPSINALGQLAFLAEAGVPNADQGAPGDVVGIWCMDMNGALTLLALQGQTVAFDANNSGVIATLNFSDFSDAGDVVARATFTNSRSAILRAGIPAPALVNYEQWRQQNITGGLPSMPHEDAEGDGISNAMEMALGLNPMVADNLKLPAVGLIAGNGSSTDALTFTYRRRINQNTLNYIVEVSPNLISWQSAAPTATQLSSRLVGDAMEEVVLRVPTLNQPRYFVRLRVAY